MNPELLNIAFEEDVDIESINHLKNTLSNFGDDVKFYEVPQKGIQASVLLLTMSSIALVFGGAFVKKLGDKAAEDCYPYIKDALSTVYRKYFGKQAEYKSVIYASSENKAPSTRYSLILALYCVSKRNERIKFLYANDWNQEQFDRATQIYMSAMASFVNDDTGILRQLLDCRANMIEPFLVAWDEVSNKLINVNVAQS